MSCGILVDTIFGREVCVSIARPQLTAVQTQVGSRLYCCYRARLADLSQDTRVIETRKERRGGWKLGSGQAPNIGSRTGKVSETSCQTSVLSASCYLLTVATSTRPRV